MNRHIFLKCYMWKEARYTVVHIRYGSCSLIRVFVIYRSLKGIGKIHQVLTNIALRKTIPTGTYFNNKSKFVR
jgi:hypothetical protein